jgi:hypothetical protein
MRLAPLLTLAPAAAALAQTSGCMSGPLDAPFGSQVSVSPGTLTVGSGQAVWEEDNIGLIEFADIMVVDSDGIPMQNIKVDVKGPTFGVYIIPREAIRAVDYPSAPEEFKDLREAECFDESGNFDNSEDWCSWYLDSVTGNYYDLGNSYAQGDGDDSDYAFRPNFYTGATDGQGRLRIWYFVDAMPVEAVTATDTAGNTVLQDVKVSGEQTLYISIGVNSTTLTISGEG